jgi:SAM-dependent methyltransferase
MKERRDFFENSKAMTHEHDKHRHSHEHGHDRAHGHDHHHHDHHPDDHHHHWDSPDYVRSWVARDASRQSERSGIIERMVAAAPFPRDAAIRILDVGGGSGVISGAFLEAFPRGKVAVQDFSAHMLEHARERLAAYSGRVDYLLSDLRDPQWATSAGGPFELAVSGIAIHNLHELAAIASCYEAIRSLLEEGGCFLDYDHFDRIGGVPLHQHMLKVAGFTSVEVVWHEHPTAIVKASVSSG